MYAIPPPRSWHGIGQNTSDTLHSALDNFAVDDLDWDQYPSRKHNDQHHTVANGPNAADQNANTQLPLTNPAPPTLGLWGSPLSNDGFGMNVNQEFSDAYASLCMPNFMDSFQYDDGSPFSSSVSFSSNHVTTALRDRSSCLPSTHSIGSLLPSFNTGQDFSISNMFSSSVIGELDDLKPSDGTSRARANSFSVGTASTKLALLLGNPLTIPSERSAPSDFSGIPPAFLDSTNSGRSHTLDVNDQNATLPTSKFANISNGLLLTSTQQPLWTSTVSAEDLQSKAVSKAIAHVKKKSTSTKRARRKHQEKQAQFAIVTIDPTTGGMHGKITKPRRAFEDKRRQEVAQVRKVGACFRCKTWNVSCGTDEPCSRCKSTASKTSQDARLLCFRPNIDDCGFFCEASTVHVLPVDRPMNWITSTPVMLRFFLAPPTWKSKPLVIPCRRFQPEEHDITTKHIDGSDADKHLIIPAYATIDLNRVRQELQSNIRHYTEVFYENTILLESTPIVRKTVQMAINYSQKNPKSLLSAALNIWTGSNLCTTERSLTGAEPLGLSPIDDKKSPLYGHVPTPPVLDNQCHTAAMDWMKKLTTELLNKVVSKIQKKKDRSQWFEIFLIMFILLDNLEYIYGIQQRFREYLGGTAAFGSHVTKTSERYIDKLTWSSRNLLFMYSAYFRNSTPFSRDSRVGALADGNLDAEARAYFAEVVDLLPSIEANEKKATDVIDHNYEMVWCRSLFV